MDADVDRSHIPQVEGVRLHVRGLLIIFVQQQKRKRSDGTGISFRANAEQLQDAADRFGGAVCAPDDLQTAAASEPADQRQGRF